jgi:3'-phosphoadenosine 5'-phosphosulfate sulfotransferase (PAPS reductase)/FAD synthetase
MIASLFNFPSISRVNAWFREVGTFLSCRFEESERTQVRATYETSPSSRKVKNHADYHPLAMFDLISIQADPTSWSSKLPRQQQSRLEYFPLLTRDLDQLFKKFLIASSWPEVFLNTEQIVSKLLLSTKLSLLSVGCWTCTRQSHRGSQQMWKTNDYQVFKRK